MAGIPTMAVLVCSRGGVPYTDLTLYAGWTRESAHGEYRFDNGKATLVKYRMTEYESSELWLPETVDGLPLSCITAGAFDGLSVTTLHLPSSLETIETGAFDGMGNLRRFDVPQDSAAFIALDGVLFSADAKTLVALPTMYRRESYSIPEGVKAIADHAFINAGISSLLLRRRKACPSVKTASGASGRTSLRAMVTAF